ncbi:hypothetical protein Ahy_B09g097935 isoform A [Arachis hypogaea]|uniref:Uncharacterized protein n=1 Tax=Arachis hypogaea TaxID=3818 RepID=A0A444XQB7_ARAHY|nr:hypothetical protein Ahy_B09g097935 isoform A [Arachis hypogaea]
MASEDSFLVLVQYRWLIKKKTRSGIKFTDKNPLSVFLKPSTSFTEFLNSIIQKLGLQGVKRVEKLLYRIPISMLRSDEDLEVLFHCRQQFSEVRTPDELSAKLVDVVSSSGGLNQNLQALATIAYSSSRPSGASSSVSVIAPKAMLVASPSFAADLNHSGYGEVGITDAVPVSLQGRAPDGMDDVLRDDDEEDYVESDIIADDSGDDIAGSNPVGSSDDSAIPPPPAHFSSLDLDAMRQQGVPGELVGFGARDTQDAGGLTEFQVDQQF